MSLPLERTDLQRFVHLAEALSPENLSRNGALSYREIQRRQARLEAEWKALEEQIGRIVCLDEVWKATST